MRIIYLLVGFMILIAAVACDEETPTLVATATFQPQTFNIGDTVQLGDLHITVNGVRGARGDEFSTPEEGNYFVYVDVTFRNEGVESVTISTLLLMELRDANGLSYIIDLNSVTGGERPPPDGELAPGGIVRGEVGYQIPVGSTGLTWSFSGNILGLGQAIFTLGTAAVPVLPPGHSLEDPLTAGETLVGSNGAEIRVLGITADARQLVAMANRFNDPPKDGMRFYMIRVEVALPSSGGSVSVNEFDFRLIGDRRVVYSPFAQTCGVIPDGLSEVFGGGQIEGNVCFEIPKDEGGLILIHEPDYRSAARRFLNLEASEE